MKTTMKRVVCMALCLLLCCGMLPMAAFAEGELETVAATMTGSVANGGSPAAVTISSETEGVTVSSVAWKDGDGNAASAFVGGKAYSPVLTLTLAEGVTLKEGCEVTLGGSSAAIAEADGVYTATLPGITAAKTQVSEIEWSVQGPEKIGDTLGTTVTVSKPASGVTGTVTWKKDGTAVTTAEAAGTYTAEVSFTAAEGTEISAAAGIKNADGTEGSSKSYTVSNTQITEIEWSVQGPEKTGDALGTTVTITKPATGVTGTVTWKKDGATVTTTETAGTYTAEVTFTAAAGSEISATASIKNADGTVGSSKSYTVTAAEAEKTAISSASVSISTPAAGSKAGDAKATVVSDPAGKVTATTTWKAKDDTVLSSSAVFEAGKTYIATITLSPAEGYEITSATTLKLNSVETTKLSWEVTIPEAEVKSVTSVSVTLENPQDGTAPADNKAVLSLDPALSVTASVTWKDSKGAAVTSFKVGETYKATVTLTAADGYKIDSSTKVKLNGTALSNGSTVLNCDRICVASLKSITGVALTVDVPGTGEKVPSTASYTCKPDGSAVATATNGVTWYISKDGSTWTAMKSTDTFTAGRSYKVVISLVPYDKSTKAVSKTYGFTSATSFTINGTAATVESVSASSAKVSRTFSLPYRISSVRPVNTDGDPTWYKTSTSYLTVTGNGIYTECTGVKVDGTLIGTANYTISSGSTIVKLKPSYLETLSRGSHTVQLEYGSSATQAVTFTVKQSNGVKTGDNGGIVLGACLGMMTLAAAGIGAVLLNRKKLMK